MKLWAMLTRPRGMETKKNDLPPELEDMIGTLSPGIPENALGDNLTGVSELAENWTKANSVA